MEKGKTTQPNAGTWDRLPTEKMERYPKVEFQINIPVSVTFVSPQPRELANDIGVYYIFDVEENGTKKVIMTSAWSLLRELKLFEPLQGKRLTIIKKMEKTKQVFEVKEYKVPVENVR